MPKPQMLIVDDERDIRSLLAEIFKPSFDVTAKGSLNEAKGLLHREKYEIVLLDLDLPDGSGFDLVASLNGSLNRDRVLIISAHKGREQMERANQLGISHFFEKPLDLTALSKTVTQLTH